MIINTELGWDFGKLAMAMGYAFFFYTFFFIAMKKHVDEIEYPGLSMQLPGCEIRIPPS